MYYSGTASISLLKNNTVITVNSATYEMQPNVSRV
jgi:hypothetical protein